VNGIDQTPGAGKREKGKGKSRLVISRSREVSLNVANCLASWAVFAMNHALSVRVAGAFRIERKPGFSGPWVSAASATAAALRDRFGYDSASEPPGAKAVTTPGHQRQHRGAHQSPSACTRRQARAVMPVSPSSGLTTPER